MTDSAAMRVHVPVAGSQSSASLLARVLLENPVELVPPVSSTLPSARMVRLICRRPYAMDPVGTHTGTAWLRSIVSAVLAGGGPVLAWPPPPTYRTLPCSYMTAEP